jgi:hypothetical protein
MGLKNLYYKLEDKYFEMLDTLEEKGINLYKIIDPLEKKGIPTFAIFLVLLLAIIFLIVYLLIPVVSTPADSINFVFKDSTGNTISSEEIDILFDNVSIVAVTNSQGIFELTNFEKKAEHILKIDDSKYKFANNITEQAITEKNNSIYLEQKTQFLTKKIYFKSPNGTIINDLLHVNISCSDSDFFASETVSSGELLLSDIPVNCGQLIVDIENREFDPYSLEVTEEVEDIYLSSPSQDKGTLSVLVKDKDSKLGIPNLNIRIIDVVTDQESDIGVTNDNGIYVSNDVLLVNRTYKIFVSDPNGLYGSIRDTEYNTNLLATKKILPNQSNDFEIELRKDVVGFIILKTIDQETNQVIPNVKVTLKKGISIQEVKQTDNDGIVRFGVKESSSYLANFDNDNYIISQRTVSVGETAQEIKLKSVDSTNQNTLIVSIIDKDKAPIEDATVKIMDAISNSLIKTGITDIYGKHIFNNLNPENTYYIEVVSGPFTGRSISNFTIKEREINEESVILDIGEGTYNLKILDTQDSPVSTDVKVYEVSTNKEMVEKETNTDSEGNAIIRIRSDKSVYFVINNFDRQFITKHYNVEANTILNETIRLPRTTTSSNIEFLGFYTTSGEMVTSISPGQSVIARFVLNVDRDYSKAVAHIRTGAGEGCGSKTYLLEEDFSYIKQINYAGTQINGSSTYTPCLGEGTDLLSFTKKDAKWFNVTINRPLLGSYLIDAEIVIRDIASQNQNVFYRAEFITGNSVSRFPLDSVLETAVSTSSKQSLYAYAKQQPIYVGSSNFCDNGVCYSFSVFDKSTKINRNIIDKFTAKENTDYQLQFRLNVDKTNLQDASLSITSIAQGKTIKLTNYFIESVGAQVINGTNDFDYIEIGNLLVNDYISGNIDLSILNDQSDTLIFSVISNGEVVFTKNILFDVRESKILIGEQIPTVLVPYVPNNILISATHEDQSPVVNADVLILKNGSVIDTGKTDNEGIFAYVLPSVNLGSTIDFVIKKQGYKSVTLTNKVTDQILNITPESLDIQLDISKTYSEKYQISLMNNTILPLYISKIESSLDDDFIDISAYVNTVLLDPAQKIVLDVEAKLNETGIELMTQKVITGELLLYIQENSLSKEWVVKIPVTVRVTFGNSVNNVNCLTIDPIENSLSLVTAEEVAEYSITLKNDCSVDSAPVSLGRIFADLYWSKNKKYGDFSIVALNNEYDLVDNDGVQILPTLKANESVTLKIRFKPKSTLKTMSAEPKIIFRTQRANINGFDNISVDHISNIVMNNYASCLELPKGTVQAMYCAMNQFMGNMYSNNFGYNPMSYDPTTMGYNQQAFGGNIGVPYSGSTFNTMQYPSLGYSQMMNQTNYQNFLDYPTNNTTYTNQFGCPATTLQVKNNCADDSLIKFDAEYGITVLNSNEITVNKNSAANVNIQGGSVLGTYKLSVYAKSVDDTVDDYTYVKDVPVTVTLPISTIPENCIEVPKVEFDFSQLIPKKQRLVIYNNCRDQGYILNNLKIKDIAEIEESGVSYFSIGENIRDLKPIPSTMTKDGKTIEVWSLDVLRKPDIETIKVITKHRTVAERVTATRTGSMQIFESIVKTPILSIGYTNPRMQLQELDKELRFIDNLQWLGLADETGTPFTEQLKDPKKVSEDSKDINTQDQDKFPAVEKGKEPTKGNLDKEALDKFNEETKVTPRELDESLVRYERYNDESGITIKIILNKELFDQEEDFTSFSGTDLKACFTGNISDFKDLGLSDITTKSYIDQQISKKLNLGIFNFGEIISSITFPQKGKYMICISRPYNKLTEDESSIRINDIYFMDQDKSLVKKFFIRNPISWTLGVLKETIYDDIYFSLTTEVGGFASKKTSYLDTSDYTITSDPINQEDGECYGPQAFNGVQGYTSLDKYKEYGFDRLLFTWDLEDITYNTCDYGKYYCDQDQLRVSMSKKVDLLKDSTKYTELIVSNKEDSLNKINFKLQEGTKKLEKDNSTHMIINLQNEIDSKFTESVLAENYHLLLKGIIFDAVPEKLQEFAIITINANLMNDNNFSEITKELFTLEDAQTKGQEKAYYDYELNDKNYYSFSVSVFLDYAYTKINNMVLEDDKDIDLYLQDFLKSMDIYYGVSLDKFIVNTKVYGDLTKDSETHKIFTSGNWGSTLNKFTLKENSIIREITKPQTVLVEFDLDSIESDNVNYTFSDLDRLNDYLNPHNSNQTFKENIFFKTPINALHYNYINNSISLPYVSINTNLLPSGTKKADVYVNYENWNEIQKGYIYTYMVDPQDNYVTSSFADIRPLQLTSTVPLNYNLEYYLSGNYISPTTPIDWFRKTESNKEITSVRKTSIDDVSENGYRLLELNGQKTLFKTTLFVLNNINVSEQNSEQLRIVSTAKLLNNLGVSENFSVTDYYKYIYLIPSNLSTNNNFNLNTSLIKYLIDGKKEIENTESDTENYDSIINNKICFNFEEINGSKIFKLWYNPSYKYNKE